MNHDRRILLSCALALLVGCETPARAESYPSKPVKIIVSLALQARL